MDAGMGVMATMVFISVVHQQEGCGSEFSILITVSTLLGSMESGINRKLEETCRDWNTV